MDEAATNDGAVFEAAAFLRHFNDLPDPRQRGKVTRPLAEVVLLALPGVLAGADSFVATARFGDTGSNHYLLIKSFFLLMMPGCGLRKYRR